VTDSPHEKQPSRNILALLGGEAEAVHGGPTPVWRGPGGILRTGPLGVLRAEDDGKMLLRTAFPTLTAEAPATLALEPLADGQGALQEHDLGAPDPEPLARIERWEATFLEARAELQPLEGRVRDLMAALSPPGRPRTADLLRGLRAVARSGAALPFSPRQAALERALDRTLTAEFTRTWGHGALTPARVLARGACHWRRFGPDHLLGEDAAPFAEPCPGDPALALHVLKAAWNHDPLRAADALCALGLVDPEPAAWVDLRVRSAPSCLTVDQIARVLGVAPGRVPAAVAARALARGEGLVVAGEPLRLEVDPPVRPRRDATPWRIRDRDPRRLFSRWHEGVRLDAGARASLTPEESALDMARRLRAATVVDGFCGAGGDSVALARMPWCREVIAVDLDPARLAMARHNAAIYGVESRIRFVQGDFLELAPRLAGTEACYLDPPWDAGPALRARAWSVARAHFSRGVLKLPRQDAPPPEATCVEAVMGVGPIVSFLLAWWGC
jgi:hypothetical protein